MSRNGGTDGLLWVERVSGLRDAGVWVATEAGHELLQRAEVQAWLLSAEQIFAASAEVASVSVVASDAAGVRAFLPPGSVVDAAQAGAAALPLCFLSGHVADLVGLGVAHDGQHCPIATFQGWIETATAKGLIHLWLVVDRLSSENALSNAPLRTVPEIFPGGHGRFVPVTLPTAPPSRRVPISLGIDAEWLLGGESGAQVFVFEMLKELASRPEIERIVMISEAGGVPRSLDGVPKVGGVSWPDALARGAPLVDILHRPYQPGADVDYRRYHQVARCVALTVLDFIAYDNPAYHESSRLWRQHQQAFDEHVRLADCVFAISRHVGSRIERQFAHQLSGPVRPVPLGTDHLLAPTDAGATSQRGPMVQALENVRFLLVLGNDFEHKNRDFAVRVFADMCDRGYEGQLVLSGFHLDRGSSFGHELSGARQHVDRVMRIGAVSVTEKRWLMRHAQAVLYPTSSEGFGLVPFEAAALGTPTAFVRFGPLRETLPGVDACPGWRVRAFADHVFRLIADPGAQVAQIHAAGAVLTWSSHVDQILDGYRQLLSDGAPWRTRARSLPVRSAGMGRAVEAIASRARRRLRHLFGRPS